MPWAVVSTRWSFATFIAGRDYDPRRRQLRLQRFIPKGAVGLLTYDRRGEQLRRGILLNAPPDCG